MGQERRHRRFGPNAARTADTRTKQVLTGKDAAPGAVGRSGTAR